MTDKAEEKEQEQSKGGEAGSRSQEGKKDQRPLGQRIKEMTSGEKIKLAMLGDKESRNLLIKENDRSIQVTVIKNPRITEAEVAMLAADKNVYEEVLREISSNREWMKVYKIRLALVQNPKTGAATAIKLLPTLQAKDVKQLAKSKSIPNAVAQAARKLATKKG
jgi:hypothetical protein